MHIYIVTGGIGKHAIFSSMIEPLCEKHGEKIAIMSGYPDLFRFHPSVEMSVGQFEPGFYDDVVMRPDSHLHYADPYRSDYIKGHSHLVDAWAGLLNVQATDRRPDIWIDDYAVEEAKRFKSKHKRFVMVQFSGGQSPAVLDLNRRHVNMGQQRDYPRELAQKLVKEIQKRHKGMVVLNYALPNEQTANLDGTITIQAPYLFYVALLQICDGYVAIDSSLQHFAANKWNSKNGVAIWGSTGPEHLGYEHVVNMTNAERHTIRPLTQPIGDVVNADRSRWVEAKQDLTHVDPMKVADELDLLIESNRTAMANFDNTVENLERKNAKVEIDQGTSQLIMSLNAQAEGLQTQAKRIVEQFVKSRGLDGSYALSDDGGHVIRI